VQSGHRKRGSGMVQEARSLAGRSGGPGLRVLREVELQHERVLAPVLYR
jgi:hypothetical protein